MTDTSPERSARCLWRRSVCPLPVPEPLMRVARRVSSRGSAQTSYLLLEELPVIEEFTPIWQESPSGPCGTPKRHLFLFRREGTGSFLPQRRNRFVSEEKGPAAGPLWAWARAW